MRNPRGAVKTLWRHQQVGATFRVQVEAFLEYHPNIIDKVFTAVTSNDKGIPGPSSEDIKACLGYVGKVLEINDGTTTQLTQ